MPQTTVEKSGALTIIQQAICLCVQEGLCGAVGNMLQLETDFKGPDGNGNVGTISQNTR